MDNKLEFWRDNQLDSLIDDVIYIFKELENVELVRLSGLTTRAQIILEKQSFDANSMHSIIRKLRDNDVIKFDYIIDCPHCGETSYVLVYSPDFTIKPKLCDTCGSFYSLLEGSNLETIKKEG